MMSLTEFLLARITHDERTVRSLLQSVRETREKLKDPKTLGLFMPGWHDWPQVEEVCCRVLAECEAKRRIVDNYSPYLFDAEEYEKVLGWLAIPYAGHEDFDPAWNLSAASGTMPAGGSHV